MAAYRRILPQTAADCRGPKWLHTPWTAVDCRIPPQTAADPNGRILNGLPQTAADCQTQVAAYWSGLPDPSGSIFRRLLQTAGPKWPHTAAHCQPEVAAYWRGLPDPSGRRLRRLPRTAWAQVAADCQILSRTADLLCERHLLICVIWQQSMTFKHISTKQDPSNSNYELEHSTTGTLLLLGDNTSISNQKVPVLSPTTAKFTGQLFHILTNNLKLKAPVW